MYDGIGPGVLSDGSRRVVESAVTYIVPWRDAWYVVHLALANTNYVRRAVFRIVAMHSLLIGECAARGPTMCG